MAGFGKSNHVGEKILDFSEIHNTGIVNMVLKSKMCIL